MNHVDAEELFPPRPGGMVDKARQRAQAEQDQAAALAGPEVSESGYPAVRVRIEPADQGTARCITLSSANAVAQLLPRDTSRRAAVILAIDNDVWISYNEGTARDLSGTSAGGNGFYLSKGIPLPVSSQAQLWAAPTTTATASRVSVITARDSTP